MNADGINKFGLQQAMEVAGRGTTVGEHEYDVFVLSRHGA